MRTTLDIDDDVLAAIKERARAEKRTAGAVISQLARQAMTGANARSSAPEEGPFVLEDGWYTLPPRGGIVTNEIVDRLIDAADLEDAGIEPKG